MPAARDTYVAQCSSETNFACRWPWFSCNMSQPSDNFPGAFGPKIDSQRRSLAGLTDPREASSEPRAVSPRILGGKNVLSPRKDSQSAVGGAGQRELHSRRLHATLVFWDFSPDHAVHTAARRRALGVDGMAVNRRIEVTSFSGSSGDVAMVRFLDRKIIDAANIQELGDELFALVEKEQRKNILLNFNNVEFLSSAALNKLIILDKKAKANSGKMKMCNLKPEIYEVFAITRLNQLFDIKNTESDALAGF